VSPAPLIEYIDRRIELVDSIQASLEARRATRPASQRAYRHRLASNTHDRLERCRKLFEVRK
jgi:hypothetical protein